MANGIKNLIIIGDSMMVIQKCLKLSENERHLDVEASSIISKINYLLKKFGNVKMFHVLWANN